MQKPQFPTIAHKLIYSTRVAVDGLMEALKSELAFRIELVVAAVLVIFAISMNLHHAMKAVLIGSVLLVLIVELLNTAVEAAVDFTSSEKHPLARKAKDAGAAAVLVSILNALIVWVLILV